MKQQELDGTTFNSLMSKIMDIMKNLRDDIHDKLSLKDPVSKLAKKLIYKENFKKEFLNLFWKWPSLSDENALENPDEDSDEDEKSGNSTSVKKYDLIR